MKRHLCAFALLWAFLPNATRAAELQPSDYVNTLAGSLSKHSFSTGNTYPAVARPWGMNFWTPQTGKMGDGWAYVYTADKICGFKQTHQPSPWINDYGQFAIMPVTSGPLFKENDRASWFSHKTETAKPYYYGVYLADPDVFAEMTSTERAAILRYTFPESDLSYIVVDALDEGSSVSIDRKNSRITGYTTKNDGGVPDNFRNWFVIESDTPFDYVATVTGGKLNEGSAEASADHVYAIVGFKTRRGRQVNLRVASSFVSIGQAYVNLRELGDDSFDETAAKGREAWNAALGRIEVKEGSLDDIRTFYSCLYRSLLFPRVFSEVDAGGKRIHYSPYDGKVHEGYLFTDTGFWDTFRSLFPLLNLLYPETNSKIQEGLVNVWLESGFLPEWASPGHRGCMVGNNSASVVADAWLSGCRGYDVEELWKAVVHGTSAVHPEVQSTGRLGWEDYNSLGYVPYDSGIRESAARTLEYAYDDWCIYMLGKALGKPENEISVYAERAMNYRNLLDPSTGWMRGRNRDSSFQSPFNPLKWGDAFTEGNSLHYTWSVFHDPAGLMSAMGGRERFVEKLDSIFIIPPHFDESYYGSVIHEIREMQVMNMGNYAHGNQPVQHMIYLYDWAGEPWKAQARVREVMRKFYKSAPDGYCGDEDNGQTSAWYVFSALGFYPVCPGSGQYALGSPLFRKTVLHLPGGHNVEINAPGNSDETPYIGSLLIDSVPYSHNYITLKDFLSAKRLDYEMSSEPDLSRGTGPEDAPYSFSGR